jgi:ADP-ribose pyrophosphatase YjhB (NUDIX family)
MAREWAMNANHYVAAGLRSLVRPARRGPDVLVLVVVYCQDRLLLVRRGCAPYAGKWAPPGGFVECHESVETAAAREVWEETRLRLDTAQLIPKGVLSITHINQIYHVFVAYVDEPHAVAPVPPESVEVRWFSQADCMAADTEIWDPADDVDYEQLFEMLRARRGDLFQWNNDYQRIIGGDGQIHYASRRDTSRR